MSVASAAVPERDFQGLNYVNDKANEYRAALNSGVNVNSRECENSSPIDFLYLSTIRGGRKTKQMSLMNAGGCGCGLTGGIRRNGRKRRNSFQGGYEGEYDNVPMLTTNANNEIYDSPEILSDPNIGNSNSSYPESSYPESSYPESSYPESSYPESSYPESGDPAMMGGCFTCKKGVKNIIHIYSTIHIIIPTLYSKYKKGVSLKAVKTIKPIKSKSPKKPKK